MKVCVIQPRYSMNCADAEACFREMLALIDQCDESLDLIVLPEYCDVPVATPDGGAFRACVEKYNPVIARKAAETAKRCHALLFANYAQKTDGGFANATHAFDREELTRRPVYRALVEAGVFQNLVFLEQNRQQRFERL